MASPTTETGLILPVLLPPMLEAVRRAAVADATGGLPAHVTLLYPFVPPDALHRSLRARVAAAVASHERFSYRLVGPARWPQVLYASIEPEAPFRALQADLAAAFPSLPIYGGAFEFVPHVTIAEGEAAERPEIAADPAWSSLPAQATARSVELIVRSGGNWQVVWRIALPATSRRPRTS
jgi:2'-5' RNA ligase